MMLPVVRLRRFAPTLTMTLVALLGAAAAPAPGVDPKIEAQAKDWLIRTQTGNVDASQLSDAFKAAVTPAMIEQAKGMTASLGAPTAFTFVKATQETSPGGALDTTYEFLVTFARRQALWDFVLDDKGKIDGMLIQPYVPPTPPPQHVSADALIPALRAKLETESKAGEFSGAVLVAKNGVPIFQQAYGLADREKKIPNTPKTRFRIGSMNKMFTAVAIMQLVQAGKIDLSATLGTYLPDYPNKDVASRVTIHQLLTHTGGTGDIFGPEYDKHRLELRTLDDYVKLYGSRGLAFKPGSKWDYSNYGFILLGVVVEKVSGQSYYDYVRDHIYLPAGMTATGSDPEDDAVSDRSVGYTEDGGKMHPNTDSLPYRGSSAGGGYSTVEDLLRFATALQSNKLLDAVHTTVLTTGKVDMRGPGEAAPRYAYGFGVMHRNGTICFGHDGGAPGMNGDLEICPSAGYVIVALANVDPPVADQIASFVADRLPR